MSYPNSVFRPLLAGFAVPLALTLSACNSSIPDEQAEVTRNLGVEKASRAQHPMMPMPVAAYAAMPMPDLPDIPDMPMVQMEQAYREPSREQYQQQDDNPVQSVAQNPVSTFSIDVDTGSYSNVRRFLNLGQLPPKGAVRLEEMVNYFSYAYPLPRGDVPFGIQTDVATNPWNAQSRLLRIAIKASDVQTAELPPANLVFLVDVSGSMDRKEGLPLVQSTLKLLVNRLRPEDKVSLVTYAGVSQIVLEPTSGKDKAKIREAIDQLIASGSTAGESGIQLAYQQAEQGFIKNGINRILLATDGDFNVGVSDFDALKDLAAEKRKTGVSLTTLGFGTDNYNERLMEQLADAGDGNYAYIDNLREARKVLVEQLSSTLATVASDVKIQVEFNPAEVSEYRLLGYENRALKHEDFSNDKVDAGEIGAGHTVTALYEVIPRGNKGWLEPLRYQNADKPNGKAGEMAWLRIRYKPLGQSNSKLLEQPIAAADVKPIEQASDDLRFAAAVAAFAQQLKGSTYMGDFTMADSVELARKAKGEDHFGLRAEFVQLAELARSLQTENSRSTPARVQQ